MDRPEWLIADPEPYEEYNLGPIKTGKEADVFLVERVNPDGRSCLLAHKRYRPREVTHKGELEHLGFQRASMFVNDRAYREIRLFGNTRDRRAAAKRSRHGRRVLSRGWQETEFEMLQRLWRAGVTVPYPVARTADGVLMQYIGDHSLAAPRLVHAGLDREQTARAANLLIDELHRMVRAEVVHADLSAFNLLWWDARLWIIDVPQAVDLTADGAFDFLHRDLLNVATWFGRKGVAFDADALLSELVSSAFG
jgi:RIO kinase 1